MDDPAKINSDLNEEISILKQRIRNLDQLVLDLRKAEELLRERDVKYRLAFESASDGIFTIDRNFNISSITPSVERQLGYKVEEVINRPIQDLNILTSESLTRATADVIKVLSGVEVTGAVYEVIAKDGTKKIGEVTGTPIIREGKILGVTAVVRDITERKKTEEALRESEEKYRILFENAGEAIFVVQDGNLVFLNPMTSQMIGYSSEELMGRSFVDFIHPDDRNLVVGNYLRRLKGEDFQSRYSFRCLDKNRAIHWMEIGAIRIEWAGRSATLNFITDITERKRVEEELKQSEERYRIVLEEIEDGYHEVDLSGNFTFFNESFRRIFGYSENELLGSNFRRYAADEGTADRVYRAYNQMYNTGNPLKRFEWDIITKSVTRRSIEFSASLLRDGEGHRRGFRGIVRDVTDRKFVEEQYRTMANSSQTGVYIVQDSRICFVNPYILSYSGYPEEELIGERILNFVHPNDRKMVREMARKMLAGELTTPYEYRMVDKNNQFRWLMETVTPISYKGRSAVLGNTMDTTERKRAEEELRQTLKSLRKAFGTTIQVMVSAVETRDPYTAGHQLRSADLARAIATEMGLSQEKIDGIRMAGSIHDIGKLSIPAEILSKPTRLTELEFSLIREHAQQGYEMLKDVESPWPLAQIVYQHHERMDGSGYPRNLKGDEILMEARIMAVADVVESMASHRPYRPALGIEIALEEIEKNKGTLYDDAVADACLTLFREKNFNLDRA